MPSPPGAVRACAEIVATRVGAATRCTTLRSQPPFTFRDTPGGLYLVGTLGGPVGGDDLSLRVALGEGASLDVTAASAMVVLPGPRTPTAVVEYDVRVGPGATLRWLGRPTVLAAGADLRSAVTIDVAERAGLVWRTGTVLGRDGEPAGSLTERLTLSLAGQVVHRSDLRLGPLWPAATSPAVAGQHRFVACEVIVGPPATKALSSRRPVAEVDGARAAVHEVADGVAVVSAVGTSARALSDAIAGLLGAGSDRRRHSLLSP